MPNTYLKKYWQLISVVSIILILLIGNGLPAADKVLAQEGIADTKGFTSTGTMNFQGQLTDGLGNPLEGGYNMRFAIYDAASAGTKKWPGNSGYESHTEVAVHNGLFSVQLGSMGEAITPKVFNEGGNRYLQIWVCKTAGIACSDYDDMGRLAISSSAIAQTLLSPALLKVIGSDNALTTSAVDGMGVYSEVTGTIGKAVYGNATSSSGYNVGVYGNSASTNGVGVFGMTTATSGNAYGVMGQSNSTSGRGVYGYSFATSGTTYGIYGRSNSTSGTGVYGYATATEGVNYGVYGTTPSYFGTAVAGIATDTIGFGTGVFGESSGPDGVGVMGWSKSTSGESVGVIGRSDSISGIGVNGYASAISGTTYGVYGRSSSASGFGVYGYASANSGFTYAVYGESNSTDGTGIGGVATATSGTTFGVYGYSASPDGRGVIGFSSSSGDGYGVQGQSASTQGIGVFGVATSLSGTNYGVYGKTQSPDGYAGYFFGKLHVTGNFTASGTKSFIIDHPLDPENQYLYHYSMEGPEPYTIYRGTVELDENGSAWVNLPDYFEALNLDYNYQLTPIGIPMPTLFIAEGVVNNRFLISGGVAGMQVSWQVTALRNDPWVRDQNLKTEVSKPESQVGKLLYPQGYGLPQEFSVDYNPERMTEVEIPDLNE